MLNRWQEAGRVRRAGERVVSAVRGLGGTPGCPSTREARFITPCAWGTITNRVLFASRCKRRNCCSGSQPIHSSRGRSLNAPACQPMSASQRSPSTATWRTLRPTKVRKGR